MRSAGIKPFNDRATRRSLLAICFAALLSTTAFAQQQQADDVVRVKTELVQTTITVVNKNGQFIDGLNRDQFHLSIEGKPRPVSFFERVTAGSMPEAQLVEGASGNAPAMTPKSVHGRMIVFFVDDLHMTADSLNRTRMMLRYFLEHEMSSKDSVAIASPSGLVGFLQQFTNNKTVFESAIARLSPIPYSAHGYAIGGTAMTEYLALDIDTKKSDNKVLEFFTEECMKEAITTKMPMSALRALQQACETQVKESARAVLMQAGEITANTYSSLETLMRLSARASGRKLLFFVSDGFLMDAGPHSEALRDKLDHVIDAAQRSGVVVYTIDSKGLVIPNHDVTIKSPIDGNGRLDMALLGSLEATQDAMNALAEDTGGRALRGKNYFEPWVDRMLDETSNYYVIAWRPEKDEEKVAKFRDVKITIAGHPEYNVRAPRGYVDGPKPTPDDASITTIAEKQTTAKSATKTPEIDLRDALAEAYPSDSLPTLLSLTFLNTPRNETVLNWSMQIASGRLDYGSDRRQPATVQVAGVILTDKGKVASNFRNQLSIKPVNRESDPSGIIYNQHTPLAPGIYQVRVAARDDKNGRVGSAMQFVVIPDLSSHELTLSSLLLGGQVLENKTAKDGNAQVQLSVDHRFSRASRLGFWVFVYNAKRDGSGAPNLAMQTQVLRDGRLVLSPPERRITAVPPDPERIPFGEDLPLQMLPPGKYDLLVTITDKLGGNRVTQTAEFEVQ